MSCMLARSYVAVGEYEQAVREAQQAVDLGQIGLGGWHIHALLWRNVGLFLMGQVGRGRRVVSGVS